MKDINPLNKPTFATCACIQTYEVESIVRGQRLHWLISDESMIV